MSDQGPSSGSGGSGKPPGDGSDRKHLNGHGLNGAAPIPFDVNRPRSGDPRPGETRAEGSVVVPFPKKRKPVPAWLGALLGWISLLAFAALVWGVSKDGRVDAIDIFAGLFGVLAALWFYRTREKE